jgi:hypothetical protein
MLINGNEKRSMGENTGEEKTGSQKMTKLG